MTKFLVTDKWFDDGHPSTLHDKLKLQWVTDPVRRVIKILVPGDVLEAHVGDMILMSEDGKSVSIYKQE